MRRELADGLELDDDRERVDVDAVTATSRNTPTG